MSAKRIYGRNFYLHNNTAVYLICATTRSPTIFYSQKPKKTKLLAVTTVALISVLLSWNVGGKIKTLYYQTLNGYISKIVGSRNLNFFVVVFQLFYFYLLVKKQDGMPF